MRFVLAPSKQAIINSRKAVILNEKHEDQFRRGNVFVGCFGDRIRCVFLERLVLLGRGIRIILAGDIGILAGVSFAYAGG